MLTLIFWDVQHGSATYIKTPEGKHLVQDLGMGSYGSGAADFSPLLHLRRRWNVNQLDGVIITHPHRDHLDDILNFDALHPRVLLRPKHLTEEEIWAGNRNADRQIIEKYLEVNRHYSDPVSRETDPLLADNNGGVEINRFTSPSCGRSNLNNHSMVTVVSYMGLKVILPGDNEAPSWTELLARDDFRRATRNADVLLAPHHGRDAGFSAELFEVFKPRITIVSDGRFGDTSATDRYAQVTRGTGWLVHRRAGGSEERKVITTRNDGVIEVKIGRDSNNELYLSVTID
jgi:competence protein ComEC